MDRRSFLSLLVAAPAIPALARLHTLAPAPPAPWLEPDALIHPPPVPRGMIEPGFFRVQMVSLPYAPDEGFDWVIPPGRIARFIATPQMIFRPERLLLAGVDEDGGPGLGGIELLGVSARGEPELSESLPATFFDPNAYGQRLEWTTTEPGFQYVMAVHNCSPTARRFQAAMIGRTIDNRPLPELTPERLAELEQEERDLDEAYEAGEHDDDDDDFA